MATLNVGAGQQFSTLAKAVAAARDGDTIAVQAGTYTNDFTTIAKDLTIEGVGGTAKFVATVAPSNGKGIMVTRADVTVRNLEFAGAKVADQNGAGIRYESGNLTVENSYFHHNQMGLLSNGDADGTITVRNSEFAFNGGGTGYTHGLYVNRVGTLTVEDSYFHDANNGHHIKSRASNTVLTDNRILDGANGISSYNIDLPNGGDVLIDGNVIHQNAKSPNVAIVSFGAEGNLIAGSSLRMVDNLVVDDMVSTNATLLVNRTSIEADLVGTDVWGLSAAQLEKGLVDVAGTSFLSSRPTLDTSSTWNDDNDDVADTPRPPAPAPGTLTGTAADDILNGTASGDTIAGLAGDDTIDGGAGADKLVGGTGDDRFVVDDGGDVIAELLGEGFDTVESSIDHTLGANVERLTLVGSAALDGTGNALDNAIYGNEAANLLRGLDGNDNLFGRPGDDRLEGGAGNDLLRGGSGRDVLVGGAGSDRFDWDSSTEAGIGTWRDVVLDFTRGSDVIDLAGIDAKSGTDADDAFRFIGGDSFNGIAGELRYRPYGTSDGVLVQGDIDGDRIGDFSIRIDGVEVLQQGDFVL